MGKNPLYEKKERVYRVACDQAFQLWRENARTSVASSPFFPHPSYTPLLSRAALSSLLATPSNGELARRLRLPTRRQIPLVGNFSSTLRFITNSRPTNLPNSSLDLVALSSYNFICLKMRNHIIFNSYLCQCPPSTHSWRKNRKDTIQIRTNNFSSTRLTHSFYENHFKKNVQSKICQKTKNQEKKNQEHAWNIPEEQFIFKCFYFPKSRKSELHNVLHGIRAHVKCCSFNTFPLGMVNIYIYAVLVQFIYVKTIIIVLSCLYQYVA